MERRPDHEERYQAEVRSIRKTIRERGCIWEGARKIIESGKERDGTIERMLREGVIVPANDPDGGYVLPPDGKE